MTYRSRLAARLLANAVLVAALPILAWQGADWWERIVALTIAVVGWGVLSYVSYPQEQRALGKPVSVDRFLPE